MISYVLIWRIPFQVFFEIHLLDLVQIYRDQMTPVLPVARDVIIGSGICRSLPVSDEDPELPQTKVEVLIAIAGATGGIATLSKGVRRSSESYLALRAEAHCKLRSRLSR